jgi:hypothetical protein
LLHETNLAKADLVSRWPLGQVNKEKINMIIRKLPVTLVRANKIVGEKDGKSYKFYSLKVEDKDGKLLSLVADIEKNIDESTFDEMYLNERELPIEIDLYLYTNMKGLLAAKVLALV